MCTRCTHSPATPTKSSTLDDQPVAQRSAALTELADRFFTDLARGSSEHPVLCSDRRHRTSLEHPDGTLEAFIESMQMDLHIGHYDTYADLEKYVCSSAAVIGLQMVPILEPRASAPRLR